MYSVVRFVLHQKPKPKLQPMDIATVSLPGGPNRFLSNLKGESRSSDVFVDRGQGEEKECFHRLREAPVPFSDIAAEHQNRLLTSEAFQSARQELLESASQEEAGKIELFAGYLVQSNGQSLYAIMVFSKRKRGMFAICDIKEGTQEHSVFRGLLARASTIKRGLLPSMERVAGMH